MGVIQPGARADLVAWKPEAQRLVTADGLHQRHSLTPYL